MSGGLSLIRDIGAYVKTVIGVLPFARTAAAVNGPSIDRRGFDSCVLHTVGGAATGSPTGQTLDAKLQESADGSTGWADIVPAIAITQIVADDVEQRVDADLSGNKRFIRVVQTVTLTAGTTPTLPCGSNVILGGATEVPAV